MWLFLHHAGGQTVACDVIVAAARGLCVQVDPMQWKLDVERVAPKLRITLAADLRDWRQHLEAAHSSVGLLAASWPESKLVLEKLGAEVAASLEKLEGRERQLNGQYDGLMEQYQGARQQLLAAQEEYNRWGREGGSCCVKTRS